MEHSEARAGIPLRALMALWVLVRVVTVTATWLLFFWGTFLGYLTVPVLLLSFFTVIYTMVDVGQFRHVRQGEVRRRAREEELRRLNQR